MTPYFRITIAVIVLIVISAAATIANAGTAQLACTPPTHNTDGSAITGAISYRFVWGTSATSLPNFVTTSTCATTVTVPDPAAGTSVTYHFGVYAIVNGAESALSNVATKTFTTPKPTPNPPTLRVVEPTAYRLDQGYKNRPTFKVAGTIPLGTACHSVARATDINGKTLHLTTRELVTPVGTWTLVAYAKCA